MTLSNRFFLLRFGSLLGAGVYGIELLWGRKPQVYPGDTIYAKSWHKVIWVEKL